MGLFNRKPKEDENAKKLREQIEAINNVCRQFDVIQDKVLAKYGELSKQLAATSNRIGPRPKLPNVASEVNLGLGEIHYEEVSKHR